MAGSSEKVPIAAAGPEDLHQFLPPVYSAVAVKPAATGRLIKVGIAVLIAGALLLLLGAAGALYHWNNEKHIYNVHYSMSINGNVEEGTMEIDSANNMERFSSGSGADEAVEVHDFEIGITGIRFTGGEKCYIKTQVKAQLPDVDALNKDSVTFDLEDEVMSAKFEDNIFWVAAETPLLDSAFLSNRIKDLCRDLPIFWLRPTYATSGQRKSRALPREKRQSALEGEAGTTNIEAILDHNGICCAECRRSYPHCTKVCEPLRGYHPWPYHYRGCRQVCRVIMPCRWWVARTLGVV